MTVANAFVFFLSPLYCECVNGFTCKGFNKPKADTELPKFISEQDAFKAGWNRPDGTRYWICPECPTTQP